MFALLTFRSIFLVILVSKIRKTSTPTCCIPEYKRSGAGNNRIHALAPSGTGHSSSLATWRKIHFTSASGANVKFGVQPV
jgi:hypothetical protein